MHTCLDRRSLIGSRHMLRGLAQVALCFGLLLPLPALAAVVLFIDCLTQSTLPQPNGLCLPGGTAGTITISDDPTNPNWVDVDAALTTPSGRTITRLFLNYNGAPIVAGETLAATNGVTPSYQSNSKGVANYGMTFDMQLSENVNPIHTVLSLKVDATNTYLDLNPLDFGVADINGLFALVNYSGAGMPAGALEAVPEPGSIALLGLGLVSLLSLRRRAPQAS